MSIAGIGVQFLCELELSGNSDCHFRLFLKSGNAVFFPSKTCIVDKKYINLRGICERHSFGHSSCHNQSRRVVGILVAMGSITAGHLRHLSSFGWISFVVGYFPDFSEI